MATEFALSVVAPDRSVVEQNVQLVIAPGTQGYFGVHAGHEPIIASLRPGLLEYLEMNGTRHYVYVGGGFAEVSPSRVTILADEAAPATEIDLAKAQEELDHARGALRGEETKVRPDDAVEVVERAVQKLRAARMAH